MTQCPKGQIRERATIKMKVAMKTKKRDNGGASDPAKRDYVWSYRPTYERRLKVSGQGQCDTLRQTQCLSVVS